MARLQIFYYCKPKYFSRQNIIAFLLKSVKFLTMPPRMFSNFLQAVHSMKSYKKYSIQLEWCFPLIVITRIAIIARR